MDVLRGFLGGSISGDSLVLVDGRLLKGSCDVDADTVTIVFESVVEVLGEQFLSPSSAHIVTIRR